MCVWVRVGHITGVSCNTAGISTGRHTAIVVVGWEGAVCRRVHLPRHVRVRGTAIGRWIVGVRRGAQVIVGWGVVKWKLGRRLLRASRWVVRV